MLSGNNAQKWELISFNPTLVEMLRQDFQLELGIAAGDLPRDESGLDIAGIWKRVRSAIKDIRGWEVGTEVVLAQFSFAKYLMWKDLVDRTEALKRNPVVRHLLETPRQGAVFLISSQWLAAPGLRCSRRARAPCRC